jgi:hypothetical protein
VQAQLRPAAFAPCRRAHDRFRRRPRQGHLICARLAATEIMTKLRAGYASLLVLVAIVPCTRAGAAAHVLSGREEIAFDRPESWAMQYYASVTLMTSLGTPRPLRFGEVRLAIEGDWIPNVSEQQRVVGFNGTKAEDLNKLPAIGRLRVSVGLGWKLSLTLSYLPPIPINGLEPDLFSLSLGRPFRIGRDFTIGAATYGQVGTVEGDFTCSYRDIRGGNDPRLNPFGCKVPSQDHVDLNYLGFELSTSYRIRPAHRLEPYASLAVNYMNLGFRVDAQYSGVIDHTQLATQGATVSMTWGVLFPVTRRLDLGTELFYTPLTVTRPDQDKHVEGLFNVRALVAYRF